MQCSLKNIFKKNNILIDGLLGDTFSFLQSTYNQTANVFTVASAWGQILFVLQKPNVEYGQDEQDQTLHGT